MSGRDGDFVGFVAACRGELTRTAYLMCGDWHQAEDVVQVVLARMYPRWPRICAGGQPHAYVRRSLVHAVIDERRLLWRRHERSTAEFPDELHPAAAVAEDRDLAGAVRVLRALPARQRAVVVLRYVEGLEVSEVAELLGISEGTVKSQAARGLAALRARTAATTRREG